MLVSKTVQNYLWKWFRTVVVGYFCSGDCCLLSVGVATTSSPVMSLSLAPSVPPSAMLVSALPSTSSHPTFLWITYTLSAMLIYSIFSLFVFSFLIHFFLFSLDWIGLWISISNGESLVNWCPNGLNWCIASTFFFYKFIPLLFCHY